MKTDHRDSVSQYSVTVNKRCRHSRFPGNQRIRRSYSSCADVGKCHILGQDRLYLREFTEKIKYLQLHQILLMPPGMIIISPIPTGRPLVREIPRNQPKATLVSDSLGKRYGGPIIFPSLFHIGLCPIKHTYYQNLFLCY